MANFFVPRGANQSLFQMTTSPEGSGSNKPFLHPWKMSLNSGQSALIGLSGGYDRGIPLRVTSNSKEIADDPSDTGSLIAPSDRILSVRGKAQGTTMLEVKAASGGEPWCFLQLKVTSLQGWIGPAGDAAFNEQVIKHLETLKKSPSFRKMWDVILKTGYTVTIIPLNEVKATRTVATRLNDSFLRDDGVTPGPGSPDTIYFDTAAKGIGLSKGNEPWRTDGAPYISLGHEMVHAWMDTTGVSLKNIYEKDNKAVGLKSFADAEFSENRFRKELGLKRREKYD